MIGGTWWSIARLLLSVLVLSAILFALLGYATLARPSSQRHLRARR